MKSSRGELIIIRQYSTYPLPLIGKWYNENVGKVRILDISSHESHKFLSKKRLICQWLKAFFKWLPEIPSFKDNKIYCTSAHLPFLFICRLFNRYLGNYHVYLHNFYIHGLGRNQWVKKVLSFLLNNDNITLIVQSESEVDYYKNLSAKSDIKFVPFCSDFKPITDKLPPGIKLPKSFIFTGGYTNRDYALILELANRFTYKNFVIVASSLNHIRPSDTTSNVTLIHDLPPEQFESLLAASQIVIVPLKEDVGSSGQMLSISAIRNKKPTIYTNLPIISYFFKSKAGYPYTIGDIESMTSALKSCLNDIEAGTINRNECITDTDDEFTTEYQLHKIRSIMGL